MHESAFVRMALQELDAQTLHAANHEALAADVQEHYRKSVETVEQHVRSSLK